MELRLSYGLIGFYMAVHAAAAAVLYYLQLPYAWLIGSLGYCLWSIVAIVKVWHDPQGNWYILHVNGTVSKMELKGFFISGYLVILHFHRRSVVIAADACPMEVIRRLRVTLTCGEKA